jgi:hypothetical protein
VKIELINPNIGYISTYIGTSAKHGVPNSALFTSHLFAAAAAQMFISPVPTPAITYRGSICTAIIATK